MHSFLSNSNFSSKIAIFDFSLNLISNVCWVSRLISFQSKYLACEILSEIFINHSHVPAIKKIFFIIDQWVFCWCRSRVIPAPPALGSILFYMKPITEFQFFPSSSSSFFRVTSLKCRLAYWIKIYFLQHVFR